MAHAAAVVFLDLLVSAFRSSSALFTTFFLVYVALTLPAGLAAGKIAAAENREELRLLAEKDDKALLT
jgi:hypothetical protein